MAKRMVTNFRRAGFPSYEQIDEDGQAKPCVLGVSWVNPDTLATIRKHGGERTGPKGERLDGRPAVRRSQGAAWAPGGSDEDGPAHGR